MAQSSIGKHLARLFCFIMLVGILCGCHALNKGSRQEVTTTPSVALALPSSGPYAGVASRIRRGANVALQELKGRGINTQLTHVDTSKSNWTQLVAQLPPAYAVVGGPLGESNYVAARKAGLLSQRMFFPFMPTLAQGDEGKLAWRFFPSPQDQIDALVNCVTDKLNIRSVGAFYPDDAYGRRMVGLLEKSLSGRHVSLQKASYNAKSPGAWSVAAKPLVNPEKSANGPIPHTSFEALFVPDSWKNMPRVATAFMDNGEDRLVFLGTTLWEQGMKGKGQGRAFLGVFPMAWNPGKAPAALKKDGDFWAALGYDFVKFASLMGLGSRPENNALALERMQKSSSGISLLAPIRWDSAGVAHQDLYMYQVGAGGASPLNVSAFQANRRAASEQTAMRLQRMAESNAEQDSAPAIDEDSGAYSPQRSGDEVSSGLPEADTQPRSEPISAPAPTQARQPLQGIESVPHTSYKLSLPVKR